MSSPVCSKTRAGNHAMVSPDLRGLGGSLGLVKVRDRQVWTWVRVREGG